MFKYVMLRNTYFENIIKVNIVILSPTGAVIETVIVAGDCWGTDLTADLLPPAAQSSDCNFDVGDLEGSHGGVRGLERDKPAGERAADLHGVDSINGGPTSSTHLRPVPSEEGVLHLAGGRDRLLADPHLHRLAAHWARLEPHLNREHYPGRD